MRETGQPSANPRSPESGDDVATLIAELAFMRKTHVDWADHFEQHPEVEAQYVATGEWDDAKEHRRCVDVYDRAIAALESLSTARARADSAEQALKEATTPDVYGIDDMAVMDDDLYSLDLDVGDVAQVWANRALGNRWVACFALPDSNDYECAVFDTEAEARAAIASSTPIPEGADRAE